MESLHRCRASMEVVLQRFCGSTMLKASPPALEIQGRPIKLKKTNPFWQMIGLFMFFFFGGGGKPLWQIDRLRFFFFWGGGLGERVACGLSLEPFCSYFSFWYALNKALMRSMYHRRNSKEKRHFQVPSFWCEPFWCFFLFHIFEANDLCIFPAVCWCKRFFHQRIRAISSSTLRRYGLERDL